MSGRGRGRERERERERGKRERWERGKSSEQLCTDVCRMCMIYMYYICARKAVQLCK